MKKNKKKIKRQRKRKKKQRVLFHPFAIIVFGGLLKDADEFFRQLRGVVGQLSSSMMTLYDFQSVDRLVTDARSVGRQLATRRPWWEVQAWGGGWSGVRRGRNVTWNNSVREGGREREREKEKGKKKEKEQKGWAGHAKVLNMRLKGPKKHATMFSPFQNDQRYTKCHHTDKLLEMKNTEAISCTILAEQHTTWNSLSGNIPEATNFDVPEHDIIQRSWAVACS
jgi:hypothetical protein